MSMQGAFPWATVGRFAVKHVLTREGGTDLPARTETRWLSAGDRSGVYWTGDRERALKFRTREAAQRTLDALCASKLFDEEDIKAGSVDEEPLACVA